MKTVSIHTGKAQPAMKRLERLLLFCGIISSILYVAINIITPSHFPGYDIASQTVSELSAIDAPSRPLWVGLCSFYSVFVIAFGCGVWITADINRQLKTTAILFL